MLQDSWRCCVEPLPQRGLLQFQPLDLGYESIAFDLHHVGIDLRR